ncbi:MAG: nucleoside-diphosphate kinase [Bacillota bacterium]|nr:nucleoside-diphosphate kinase [Bacillota bacterium]HHU29136.1 nucleoside-diphosphate kinase [Bacillota bacterium]
MERTFVMVKPDGVQRNLVGEIIGRFERKGFKLVGMKLMRITPDLAARHYAEHREKPFYNDLISFITSGPVVAMVWEGLNAVSMIREMMGKTNPAEAVPGTIRGDFAINLTKNVIHGSDSLASAKREIGLFFTDKELIDY